MQFIRPPREQPVWTKTYRRNISEMPALQNDVIQAIISEIQTAIASHEQFRVTAETTVNPEAYELYLEGAVLLE